jgi:hypothetical protein
MLENLTYYNILGLPLIFYLGIISIILFIAAAYAGYKNKPIKIHKGLAVSAVIFAVIHVLLALLVYI